VNDIRNILKSLQESGAQIQQDVKNVGGGRLIATVKDGDGNLIGLLQDT
jgi:predicted enzyme related to lactoylglutathione lyase